MKMFKRMISVLCLSAVIFTTFCSVANAEGWESWDQLTINEDQGVFSDLVFVSEGKLYVPVRLMFPISNDKDKQIGMSIAWSGEYNTVRLIHGGTTGGALVDGAPPFIGMRSCIDIILMGDLNAGATGYLTYTRYENLEDLYDGKADYDDSMVLKDPVYVREVNGGSRVFVSAEDMIMLSDLLGLASDYAVKLYNYVQ